MTGTAPTSPAATSGSAAPTTGTTSGVPIGTRDDVLAWVGSDPARAQQAYDAELQSASPRTTLLAELQNRGAVPA